MDIQSAVRKAGVVGAGGAGFPTHAKLAARVEYVLANGAECEPLLHKDAGLTETYTDKVIKGMELSVQATRADKAIFGIKAKREGSGGVGRGHSWPRDRDSAFWRLLSGRRRVRAGLRVHGPPHSRRRRSPERPSQR